MLFHDYAFCRIIKTSAQRDPLCTRYLSSYIEKKNYTLCALFLRGIRLAEYGIHRHEDNYALLCKYRAGVNKVASSI